MLKKRRQSLVVGIPSNLFVLLVVIHSWQARSASSWIMLNLAIADILQGIVYNEKLHRKKNEISINPLPGMGMKFQPLTAAVISPSAKFG